MCFAALAAIPAALGSAAGAGSALGTIATVASLAGTAVSAVGQIQAGKAAQAAAEYDAKYKRAMAADAIQRGESEAMEQRRKTRAVIGTQKATMAASGLDVQSGSPLDILGDTAAVGELDALTIKNNADREATGLQVGAQLSQMQGKSDAAGARLGAFGTALGGLATVADKWYRGKTATAAAR